MDFELAFTVGCLTSVIITCITTYLFVNAFRHTRVKLSVDTKKALVLYGSAYILISLSVPISFLTSQPAVLHTLLPVFLVMLSSAQLYILESDYVRRRKRVAVPILLALGYLSLLSLSSFVTDILSMGIIALLSLIVVYYAIKLAITTPTAFSVSSIVLLAVLLVPYMSGFYVLLPSRLHYFPVVLSVVAVACGILASMLRRWRYMIVLTIAFLTAIVAASLIYASIVAGQYVATSYAIVAGVASITLLIPLGYFVEQATATHARTPLFVAITLVSVSLLAVTHSVNFAYSFIGGDWFEVLSFRLEGWDFWILYFDWIVGLCAVTTFLLASIASTFSERTVEVTMDLLLFASSILGVLGHPYIRTDIMGAERWALLPLYIPVLILIFIAVFTYVRFTLVMRARGSGGPALRFVRFVFAMFGIGIVVMFSDRMPYIIVILLMLAACGLLIGSNPATADKKKQTIRSTARKNEAAQEVS